MILDSHAAGNGMRQAVDWFLGASYRDDASWLICVRVVHRLFIG
jgi:hypothetical protein